MVDGMRWTAAAPGWVKGKAVTERGGVSAEQEGGWEAGGVLWGWSALRLAVAATTPVTSRAGSVAPRVPHRTGRRTSTSR